MAVEKNIDSANQMAGIDAMCARQDCEAEKQAPPISG